MPGVGKKGGVAAKVAMSRVDAARVDISAALTRSFDASSLELFCSSTAITDVSSSSSSSSPHVVVHRASFFAGRGGGGGGSSGCGCAHSSCGRCGGRNYSLFHVFIFFRLRMVTSLSFMPDLVLLLLLLLLLTDSDSQTFGSHCSSAVPYSISSE